MSLENKEPESQVSKSQGLQSRRKWSTGRKILTGLGAVCLLVLLIFVSNILITTMKREKNKEKYEDAEYVKQDTMKYLEERYGEEFEIESVRGMSYAYDYINMYAYPKGFQDETHKFKIQGRFNEEGNLEYCDSYVMVKIGEEYGTYVDQIIDEYFDDYKFFLEFDSEWITSNLPPDTRVEDLFELGANVDYPMPRLFLLTKASQKQNFTEGNIMDMGKKLANWGYRGEINLFYYSDDAYFEKKNNENKRKCLEGEEYYREYHWMFIEDQETIQYD